MIDDKGRQVKEAGPSLPGRGARPVRRAVAPATRSRVVENEARAREVAAYRQSVLDTQAHHHRRRPASTPCSRRSRTKQAVEFPLVIKGDVQGSVEAIVTAVNKISNDDIKARVLHAGVGGSPRAT